MNKKYLYMYIILFYLIWSFNEMFLWKIIDINISNEIYTQLIKTVFIKNLVWTIPSLFFIYKYDNLLNIKLKEMFNFKINWMKILSIIVIFTVYLLIGAYQKNNSLYISSDFGITKIIVLLFVGLTEELVFKYNVSRR